jgi:cytochrome c-type biogenesis protein CcmF
MGGLLASPDIKKFFDHDIYSHISSVPDPSKEKDWSEVKESQLSVGDTIYLNDYFAVFRGVEPAQQTAGLGLAKGDLAIQADMLVFGEKKQYHVHPVFVVRNKMIGRVPDEIEDLGLRISMNAVDPTAGKFTFGVSTTQKDYIILKAVEKPFINLLWSGTLLMALGFGLALRNGTRRKQPVPAAEPVSSRVVSRQARPEAVA